MDTWSQHKAATGKRTEGTMSNNTYTALEVDKISGLKVACKGGYMLLNGYGLRDTNSGELVSLDGGATPYVLPRRKLMESIRVSGLIGKPSIWVA